MEVSVRRRERRKVLLAAARRRRKVRMTPQRGGSQGGDRHGMEK